MKRTTWEYSPNGHLGSSDGPPVIAFDIGGTHIRCVIVGSDGTLSHFEKDRIPSVPAGATLTEVTTTMVDTMVDYAQRVAPFVEPTSPIAISVPGPVDRDGVVYTAAPLFGDQCPAFDLSRSVSEPAGRECFVVNDVSAAAWYLSERIPSERFMVLTVSSSIGSKIFDGSRAYAVLDDVDYAGEIGHVKVATEPDAPLCDCGGTGHLSAIASGRGVERAARRHAQQDGARFRASACYPKSQGKPHLLTNEEHIVPAIVDGDEWATEILRGCTLPLGHVLRSIVVANGIQKIAVIGGFAASLGSKYLDVLQESLDENRDFAILEPHLDGLLWREVGVPEECLLGAAAYGRRRAGQMIAAGEVGARSF